MEIIPYVRKAQYYETDQMGIIHHANYIHWLEEARIDFMDQIGYSFAKMEQEGIASAMAGLQFSYKRPVLFGETVVVHTKVTLFTGARMSVAYRVTSEDGSVLHGEGQSMHAFLNREGRPVSLKKVNPQLFALFTNMVEKGESKA